MKRLRVSLREEAIADLQDILTYITEQGASEAVALSFIDRIEAKCRSIGDFPNGYPIRTDLGDGVRLAPFERSAVIAFRVLDEVVELTNIFYGGRDYSALLRD